ncbi:hypothetical protein Tco_0948051 [Tanacetum coccineum]
MMTLQFADTHNLVVFLTKSTESEGFEQIVDFLNGSSIRYALTVNPTIYTSCIEQFWSTVKEKMVNGEVQLQALVDRKKIVVTKAYVRRDLQLEDANGVDCLPNDTNFEQLTLMRYEKLSQKLTFYKAFLSPQWKFLIHTIFQCLSAKTTAWNEFSSTISFAIICLATNQKFNFSKYIFESMMKNLDNAIKFLVYPRFVQVFLNNQLEGMATHNRIYITPTHTQKIFANIRRQGKDFFGKETPLFPTMVVQAQEQGEGSPILTDPHHTPIITQPSSSKPQRKLKSRRSKEKDTKFPQSSIPSDNLADEAVNEENVSKHSNDPLLSGEDRLKLKELMALCTNLQNKVLDLEHTKNTQALEIDNLKRRIKKLEKKQRSKTHGLKILYKVGLSARVVSFEDEGLGEEDTSKQGRKIHDIDANEDITLENVHDEDMFDVNDLDSDEVVVESEVADKNVNLSVDEVTLAQALAALKSAKVQEKEDVIKETSVPVNAASTKSKNDQLKLDEELAFRLQAEEEEEEEERLAREKAQQIKEANTAWDDIQSKVEVDYQLAQRLHDEEQEQAEAKRNKPPTQAQQRKLYSTYLKNMEGYTLKQLKGFKFELIEESSKKGENEKEINSKRTGEELESDKSKKQKLDEKVEAEVDDAKEAEELKQCLEIVLDDGDDVTVNATPLSVKMPIVDYKIYQEGKKRFFQIIRADGNYQMYLTFTKMLKNFDKEDLEVLWSIVKARFKKTEPVNYMDTFLHLNLKTMFEHHLEDNVWNNQ